ncbi:MAG: L,D-transpeptidase family protein [Patescibacteria group bacterium]
MSATIAHAEIPESDDDSDGIPTAQEVLVYGSNPSLNDTDGDGFLDGQEVRSGYSPLKKGKRLVDVDTDADGLNDYLEIAFGTNTLKKDSDSDGYSDGDEVAQGYDPASSSNVKLEKHIEVNLTKQRLSYYLGSVQLGDMMISSGKWDWPTPTGTFRIINKSPKAWSKLAGLWMPYWMGFAGGRFGIHDLPVWPNGVKEGENHIGKPVSHGCIRVSTVYAKKLYSWTPIGSRLVIKK